MPLPRRLPRRRLPLFALLAALSVTACASDPGPGGGPSQGPQAGPAPSPPVGATSDRPDGRGPLAITITIGGRAYPATLADNPTARDLAAQLPLTLTFSDYNRVEKIAPLPRPLTTQGVPAGADPEVNDIGYYAPTGDLVLYYGDVGYFSGIVRLGILPDGMPEIARLPDGFTATISRP